MTKKKVKPFSQNLIAIKAEPALMQINFDELKEALATELQKYDITVTLDTVKDAKALATELNKTASVIDQRRKEAVAQVSEPIKTFDAQMKELVTMCKDGREKINSQVKQFEDETRERARILLMEYRDELWELQDIHLDYRNADIHDLVLLTSLTDKGNLTAGAKAAVEQRVRNNRYKQDKVNMRLLQLENACYKAGMTTPLTQEHVKAFLLAEDEDYNRSLERLIASELRRQEEAEIKMREKLEKERLQQEQQHQKEFQQKAEQEIRSDTLLPQQAPLGKPPETKKKPTPAAEPEPEKAPPGKVALTVVATFEVAVPPTVTDEAVISKLREKLEQAGITSLKSIVVDTIRN